MDRAQKYYTPREWRVYKSIRDRYKVKRLHCYSEYDLISLTFEMSALDAAIEFEDCRFILEDIILKNSRKANETRSRLNALSRSIHGDFVRKYIQKNHAVVAYEIKNLIAARQTEERLRRELEGNDYDEVEDHYDTDAEFAENRPGEYEDDYYEESGKVFEKIEEPTNDSENATEPSKKPVFDSFEYDVFIEDIVNNEEVEDSTSEPEPEPEPEFEPEPEIKLEPEPEPEEQVFVIKAKTLKEFIAELNQML